jgi:hypothetical protein
VSKLTIYRAVELVEGRAEGGEEDVLEAWQYLVDTQVVWQLQGSLGRQAVALIKAGIISPAPEDDV